MRLTRPLPAVLLAAALALGATACGGAEETGGPTDGMTAGQAVAEYRTEAARLALAPGWSWPAALSYPEKMDDGGETHYQRGFGTKEADYFWYCSWSSRAVSARLPDQERTAALQKALAVRDTYFYRTSLDDRSRSFFENVLQQAALGDLGPITQDVQANCPAPNPA